MTYYTVYKVTNKINGKFYIGTHKTKDLDGGYMGSGKYLNRAINKHGIENFEKEILFVFDNPEEMYAKEAELVNEDFLSEENTYNLKIGGFGGWDYVNATISEKKKKERAKRGRRAANEKGAHLKGNAALHRLLKEDPEYRERWLHNRKQRPPPFEGKKHKEESKKKIGEANRLHQKGRNNSQFGTRWIHSLEEKRSKKIQKKELLPEGWKEGRKMKFTEASYTTKTIGRVWYCN